MVGSRSRVSILACVAASLAVAVWVSIDVPQELAVVPGVLDFDEVAVDHDASRRLTIRNPTRQPAFVRLSADCDCVTLSRGELTIPARGDATVDVTLARHSGERRERLHTFLESELEIAIAMEGPARGRRIPIHARFFETYAVDRAACEVTALVGELDAWSIGFSAASSAAGRPTIGRIPSFVDAVEVTWDDEFAAGELVLAVKPDTPPGRHQGQIEMRLSARDDEASRSYPVAIAARVRAPYRFEPEVVLLDDFVGAEGETVTLRALPGTRCEIRSVTCESDQIRLRRQDRRAFTVHHAEAGQPLRQASSVIHIEIDVAYETGESRGTAQERYPVYVYLDTGGGDE